MADVTAATLNELAEYLGVTVRRVRQLRDEGHLIDRGSKCYDVGHALLASRGQYVLGQTQRRGLDRMTLVAVGWLHGFIRADQAVSDDDIARWRKACTRWNVKENTGALALANAVKVLGQRAPPFKGKA